MLIIAVVKKIFLKQEFLWPSLISCVWIGYLIIYKVKINQNPENVDFSTNGESFDFY